MHLRNVSALDTVFLMGEWGSGSSTMSVFLQTHWAWTECHSHSALEHLVLVTKKKRCIRKWAVVYNHSHSWVNEAFMRNRYCSFLRCVGKEAYYIFKGAFGRSQA